MPRICFFFKVNSSSVSIPDLYNSLSSFKS
nr:MAG TPA: hypothetical protein [Caudoviricetes sp.]